MFFIVVNLYATRYAGEIFRLYPDARISSLGGIHVAVENWGGLYNPSLVALQNFRGVRLSHSSLFNGMLYEEYINFQDGKGFRIPYGISVIYIGGSDIPITTLPDTTILPSETNRPYKIKSARHRAILACGSLSLKLNERAFAGVNLKTAYQKLYTTTGYSFGIDIGAVYRLSENIQVGLKLENPVPLLTYWSSKEKEFAYSAFYPGFSFTMPLKSIHSELLFSSTLEYLFEENALTFFSGVEFFFQRILAIRAGYDRESYTLGAGLSFSRYSVDALLKEHQALEKSYNITLGIKF